MFQEVYPAEQNASLTVGFQEAIPNICEREREKGTYCKEHGRPLSDEGRSERQAGIGAGGDDDWGLSCRIKRCS